MATIATNKQLGQVMPNSGAATLLYQCPNSTTRTIIKTIIVCNVTAASKTYSIWVNQSSNTTGDQFALVKSTGIAANASDQRIYSNDSGIILQGSGASIIIQSSVGSSLTFTAYGVEIEET